MNPTLRSKIFTILSQKNADFFNLIHPTSYVAKTESIGNRVIISPFVYVGTNAKLHDNTVITIHASVEQGAMISHSSFLGLKACLHGNAVCGEKAFIGSLSTINVGIKIGSQRKLSNNSILTKNCPEKSLVFDVPEKFRQIYR